MVKRTIMVFFLEGSGEPDPASSAFLSLPDSFFVLKQSFLLETYFEVYFLHELIYLIKASGAGRIMGLRILIIELDFNRRLSEWGQEGKIRVMAQFP